MAYLWISLKKNFIFILFHQRIVVNIFFLFIARTWINTKELVGTELESLELLSKFPFILLLKELIPMVRRELDPEPKPTSVKIMTLEPTSSNNGFVIGSVRAIPQQEHPHIQLDMWGASGWTQF